MRAAGGRPLSARLHHPPVVALDGDAQTVADLSGELSLVQLAHSSLQDGVHPQHVLPLGHLQQKTVRLTENRAAFGLRIYPPEVIRLKIIIQIIKITTTILMTSFGDALIYEYDQHTRWQVKITFVFTIT